MSHEYNKMATHHLHCGSCNRRLPKTSFSKKQWAEGDWNARCSGCMHSNRGGENNINPSDTARRNQATRAKFMPRDLEKPFAEGTFRWVAKGKYIEGERKGELCVCKWFKAGGVMEASFYDCDIAASKEAARLIEDWNRMGFIKQMVRINLPQVWSFAADSKYAGRKVLQEPWIKGYQRFNSNTGWAANKKIPWARVMQALSHFTYHTSNGQTLLCDLQGGADKDSVVLTDPVVMSTSCCYGPTDLGPRGISSFFHHHVCNEFCRRDWIRPSDQRQFFRISDSTTMEGAGTRGGGGGGSIRTGRFSSSSTITTGTQRTAGSRRNTGMNTSTSRSVQSNGNSVSSASRRTSNSGRTGASSSQAGASRRSSHSTIGTTERRLVPNSSSRSSATSRSAAAATTERGLVPTSTSGAISSRRTSTGGERERGLAPRTSHASSERGMVPASRRSSSNNKQLVPASGSSTSERGLVPSSVTGGAMVPSSNSGSALTRSSKSSRRSSTKERGLARR